MLKNIDEISSEITTNVERLNALLKEKMYTKPAAEIAKRSGPIRTASDTFLLLMEFMNTAQPLDAVKNAATTNKSSFHPTPLDLKELNALRSRLLRQLFSNESQLQADDFPEGQLESYHSTSAVRSVLRIDDYILSFVTNYRILEHYFRLPKTNIELAWDALDASCHAYNDALNVLNKDTTLKYTSPNRFVEVPKEILLQMFTYLEPTQLITISHDHALSRYFNPKEALDKTLPSLINNGFKENVFIHINPLLLYSNTALQTALKTVLEEGFHVSLFKTIHPERLLQTPRFDVQSMPEAEEGTVANINTQTWWRNNQHRDYIDYLPPNMFPESHRAIRGQDLDNRPFISILNQHNCGTVTFFQRYTDNKNVWTTGICGVGSSELGAMGSNTSFNIPQEAQKLRFLAYINASCPQANGESCNLEMLPSLAEPM